MDRLKKFNLQAGLELPPPFYKLWGKFIEKLKLQNSYVYNCFVDFNISLIKEKRKRKMDRKPSKSRKMDENLEKIGEKSGEKLVQW